MQVLHQTSFDEGFEPYEGEQHLVGPVGWGIAWVPGDKPGPVRPEVQAELRSRGDRGVLTGEHGVKMCHAYAFFDGVFYRHFAAAPGLLYRALVYTTAECSGDGLACQIGIDPFGGIDFHAEQVAWSPWYGTDDPQFKPYLWLTVATEAIAEADQITVYLHCKCRYPHEVNAGFFDDFTLLGQEPTEPPPAGDDNLIRYIEALQDDVNKLQGHLDATSVYIGQNKRACLLVE